MAQVAHIARATQVPDEDKIFLSQMGYDVAAYLGNGLYGVVFNGVCNQYASYRRSLRPDEEHRTDLHRIWDPLSNRWMKEIKLHGKTCAIKLSSCEDKKWTETLYFEAQKSVEFEHPNIVETYLVCKTPKNIYIVMEYLNGGTLQDYLLNIDESDPLSQSGAMALMNQLASGLQYLHSKGVVHGDFHLNNIILNQVREGDEVKHLVLKICDFGTAGSLKTRKNQEDLRYLGLHFRAIIEASNFEDTAKKELMSIADKLQDQKFKDIDEVVQQLAISWSLISRRVMDVPKPSGFGRLFGRFKK